MRFTVSTPAYVDAKNTFLNYLFKEFQFNGGATKTKNYRQLNALRIIHTPTIDDKM